MSYSGHAGGFARQSGGQGRFSRQDEVKTMMNQDTIREATRLTHAGQLEPPRSFSACSPGERAPDATSRTPERISLLSREPPTIQAKSNDIEETDGTPLTGPVRSSAQAPVRGTRKLREFYDWICAPGGGRGANGHCAVV